MSVFVDACVKFCKEKAAGTVASHAWPFLLRRIWLEALSCRRRMPEKRSSSKYTSPVDNFFYRGKARRSVVEQGAVGAILQRAGNE
jgi:hypothetical protein